jgi:hypothetical protein
MSCSQSMDCRRGALFQLVLEHNETQELQIRFGNLADPLEQWGKQATHRFIRCAFSQVNPSMLLPAMAITRKPLRV